MNNRDLVLLILFSILGFLSSVDLQAAGPEYPEKPKHGQLYHSDSAIRAWDSVISKWVTTETFWLNFATTGKGKFWGKTSVYPAYGEVSEYDTIFIELDQGPCLMEFFHRRWRRAQDVRRWDSGFNDYGGCPHVFD